MLARSMPKATKKKYYAVRRGREGPRIYETWDEVLSQLYIVLALQFEHCFFSRLNSMLAVNQLRMWISDLEGSDV